jgi:hypothetical protein
MNDMKINPDSGDSPFSPLPQVGEGRVGGLQQFLVAGFY